MRNQPKVLVSPDDATALAALLRRYYPPVYRMAIALSGDANLAGDITRTVLRQSLTACHRWQVETDAARWFAHHTILVVRQHTAGLAHPANDPLLAMTTDPEFSILLRTLRLLPAQQREAFLLHHGPGFDLHQLAISMDCSTEAASNHLVAAAEALRPIAAGRLGEFTAALPMMLGQLQPPPERIALEVTREIRKNLWPRRLMRWVVWPLIWLALIGAGLAAWKFFHMVEI